MKPRNQMRPGAMKMAAARYSLRFQADTCQRLRLVTGVGLVTASEDLATVTSPRLLQVRVDLGCCLVERFTWCEFTHQHALNGFLDGRLDARIGGVRRARLGGLELLEVDAVVRVLDDVRVRQGRLDDGDLAGGRHGALRPRAEQELQERPGSVLVPCVLEHDYVFATDYRD